MRACVAELTNELESIQGSDISIALGAKARVRRAEPEPAVLTYFPNMDLFLHPGCTSMWGLMASIYRGRGAFAKLDGRGPLYKSVSGGRPLRLSRLRCLAARPADQRVGGSPRVAMAHGLRV